MNNKRAESEQLRRALERYTRKFIRDLPANHDITTDDPTAFERELTEREYTMILYRLMDSFGTPIQDGVQLIDHVRANTFFGGRPYDNTINRAEPINQLHLNFESAATAPTNRPPRNAEYLLYLLLRRDEREFVIGDLIEGYGNILTRFNKGRADLWFYEQVVGSVLPLLRRALLRIGALVWLGRVLRRLVS